MNVIVLLLALGPLIFIAYRGFSVILFAPVCAPLAVLVTDPIQVAPYLSIFVERLAGFVKPCFFAIGFFSTDRYLLTNRPMRELFMGKPMCARRVKHDLSWLEEI